MSDDCQTTDSLGIAPQIPHEILNHGISSWGQLIGGLLLKLPMKSQVAERFLWGFKRLFVLGVCASSSPLNIDFCRYFFWWFDGGITPQIPHKFSNENKSRGELIRGILLRFPMKSKGKTLCISSISKVWFCVLFLGLRVASLPIFAKTGNLQITSFIWAAAK